MTYISDAVSRSNVGGDLDMQGNRLIGLPDPSAADEAVRKADIGVLGVASNTVYDLPVLGEFTNLNMGGSSAAVEGSGAVNLFYDHDGTIGGITQAVPSAPWTLIARLTTLINPTGICQAGIACLDDSNKIEWLVSGYNPGVTNQQINIIGQQWNSLVSHNNSNLLTYRTGFVTPLWWKIRDDGTTYRTYSISNDGVQYIRIAQVGRTSFLTATKVGLLASAATGVQMSVSLQSWTITSG